MNRIEDGPSCVSDTREQQVAEIVEDAVAACRTHPVLYPGSRHYAARIVALFTEPVEGGEPVACSTCGAMSMMRFGRMDDAIKWLKNDIPSPTEAKLREASVALVAKLDECEPHITGAFGFAAIHGSTYDGPNYGAELKTLRAALADTKETDDE